MISALMEGQFGSGRSGEAKLLPGLTDSTLGSQRFTLAALHHEA